MISARQFGASAIPAADSSSSSVLPDSLRTYYGYIQSTDDALLVFEACRLGRLPRTSRRLTQPERRNITSGSVFVFEGRESGIKRWTDGLLWSPSRISENFLVYREVDHKDPAPSNLEEYNFPNGAIRGALTKDDDEVPLGPLTSQKGTYFFKPSGMIKKTISISIDTGTQYHMVSYYRKEDVDAGIYCRPSNDQLFADIEVSNHISDHQNFRRPKKSLKEMRSDERSRRRRSSTPYESTRRRLSTTNSNVDSLYDYAVVTPEDINETALILAGLQNTNTTTVRIPKSGNNDKGQASNASTLERKPQQQPGLPSLPSIFADGNPVCFDGMNSITPATARYLYANIANMERNPLIPPQNSTSWHHFQYPVKIASATLPPLSFLKNEDAMVNLDSRPNGGNPVKSPLDISSLISSSEDQ